MDWPLLPAGQYTILLLRDLIKNKKMFNDYLRLRKMGHDKGYSFKVASAQSIANLIGLLFGARPSKPDEVIIEENLCKLEEILDPNYKSNMKIPIGGFVPTGPTMDLVESSLLYLHTVYLGEQTLFSEQQVSRYEAALEKLPLPKHNELLKAIESNDVERYWKKRDEEWESK